MTEQKTESSNLELARLLFGRHTLWIVIVLASGTVLFTSQCGYGLALGVALNFAGLLLPAWHLSNKVSVYPGKFKDLEEVTKQGLWVSFGGILITASGYYLALGSLYEKCAA